MKRNTIDDAENDAPYALRGKCVVRANGGRGCCIIRSILSYIRDCVVFVTKRIPPNVFSRWNKEMMKMMVSDGFYYDNTFL